jgi:hypothetical protein
MDPLCLASKLDTYQGQHLWVTTYKQVMPIKKISPGLNGSSDACNGLNGLYIALHPETVLYLDR